MNVLTILPADVNERCRNGQPLHLIDVRTPAEFAEAHAEAARNMPLHLLEAQSAATALGLRPNDTVYVMCRSGARGKAACEKFLAGGFTQVFNVEGGLQAWEQVGLPLIRGRKSISLERQVRIAAGTLVLLGVLLGWFVHPYFVGLSAFVGAGLVFAGITDTCGMGMLLARMPWNTSGAVCASAGAAPPSCRSVV